MVPTRPGMPESLPDDDEQNLIYRARDHLDPDAFRVLYRHYFPRVYGYIAYRVGTVHDAEDLTADTFLRVLEALPQFGYRGAGSFAAWVFRIAHQQVAGFYRVQRRTVHVLSLDELPEAATPAAPDTAPDAYLIEQERFHRLRAMLATLSPRRQEIITLRFYGGLRNQEIAAVLGLDERTIASHLSRALDDLHTRYARSVGELSDETTDEIRTSGSTA